MTNKKKERALVNIGIRDFASKATFPISIVKRTVKNMQGVTLAGKSHAIKGTEKPAGIGTKANVLEREILPTSIEKHINPE